MLKKLTLLKKAKQLALMKLNAVELLITAVNCKMKSYCLKCRKATENKNPKVSSTSNGKQSNDIIKICNMW